MQNFRNLQVWQKAHQLALNTYDISAYLLKPEAWPLRDQILRATISIPSNIAEGTGRGSDPDFRRFLWHSVGSCNELDSQLLLGHDLSSFRVQSIHVSGTIYPKSARCSWA